VQAPTERSTKLTYRKDIDGLRGVAVLLVLFDHLRTRWTGGYVGVDVFFVISGFLISSQILSEVHAGGFSIVSFYERRIRRIFPALLCMMLVVGVLAYRYQLPSELEAYARSSIAALLSVSNMLFWHQASYFDAQSAVKPLLHTWSLAVEEQFYLFFPMFLLLIRRWNAKRVEACLWIVAGCSFAAACFYARRDPAMAFFFAPLRAWELLIGTIVSQEYLPAIRGRVGRNAAAAAGLAMILLAGWFYTERTSFPGVTALVPCVGAALIILAGKAAGEKGGSAVGRLLAWKPIAFVGLISYSLYLWHWPLLVFQRTSSLLIDRPIESKETKLVVLVASLMVATLSWLLVETPSRKGGLRPGRAVLFAVNGVVAAVMLSLGVGAVIAKGVPSRFSKEALQIAGYATYEPSAEWREHSCFLVTEDFVAGIGNGPCLRNDHEGKSYLLLGDSMAAQLYPGLHSSVFPELNILQATAAACRPLISGPVTVAPVYDPNCRQLSAYLFGDYLLHARVDTVLMAAGWQAEDLSGLGQTVAWLQQHGMRVIVFGPWWSMTRRFRTCLWRRCAAKMRRR
jgi:peptidoglycan/LPS O-acetylase OafA/YrhL